MCDRTGSTAVEPLWGSSTDALFDEWIASGREALIVTARAELLDATWLGRRCSADMLPEFARLGVDPCGERGEYHTRRHRHAAASARRCALRIGERVQRSGCWALDVDGRCLMPPTLR